MVIKELLIHGAVIVKANEAVTFGGNEGYKVVMSADERFKEGENVAVKVGVEYIDKLNDGSIVIKGTDIYARI